MQSLYLNTFSIWNYHTKVFQIFLKLITMYASHVCISKFRWRVLLTKQANCSKALVKRNNLKFTSIYKGVPCSWGQKKAQSSSNPEALVKSNSQVYYLFIKPKNAN